MPDADIGPVVHGGHVETALRDLLKEWMPYYVSQVDVIDGLDPGTTEPPITYSTSSDSLLWAEETPPALIVVNKGVAEATIEKHGDHASYAAWWNVSIGVTAGGASEDGTRKIAWRLSAAAFKVLTQQGHIRDVIDEIRYVGEQPGLLGPSRKLLGIELQVLVHVPRMGDTRGLLPRNAPEDPTGQAPPPLPTPVGRRIRVTPTTPEETP